MNKEELTKEVEKLQTQLEAHEDQVKDINHDLAIAKQRLEDCNKPKLTRKQFDELHKVIETSIENFDFNSVDNYNAEMGMEYDNKVYLDCIEFECHDDLASQVISDVESLFGVTDEDDEENESKPLSE
jgi:predicted nuclease with TOPRIM domain